MTWQDAVSAPAGPGAQRPAVVRQTSHEDQRILDALYRLNEHDRRFIVEIITKEEKGHGTTGQ